MAKCRWCKDTCVITVNFKTKPCTDCNCTHQPCNEDSSPQDFPENSNLRNGWYSQSMAAEHGFVVYSHAETGKEVIVTEVSISPQPMCARPDVRFVGIVDKYVRGSTH